MASIISMAIAPSLRQETAYGRNERGGGEFSNDRELPKMSFCRRTRNCTPFTKPCLTMKKITSGNYKKDKLYVSVSKAVAELMQEGEVVSPVSVLVRMGRLEPQKYEDWRFGRVPYLERVLSGNLSKANRILRILHCHAESLQLTAATTLYRKWGKGRKLTLQFSKSGNPNIERAYSQHYLTKRQRVGKKNQTSNEGNRHVSTEEAGSQATTTTQA